MPERAYRLLLPLAALLAVAPLLVQGPSCGHDLNFHLLSWLEAAAQLTHGGYPHWAFTPAWNAGEPRFIFYPPISWLLGATLGMILPWLYVPAAFTWCSLTLSGFLFHRFARRFTGPTAATLAAILYLANPYMLFVAYERTAYAELLAAAWLPLLFAAAFAPRLRVLAVAGPIALLWMTNVPAAIMGSYALAVLLLMRLLLNTERKRRLGEVATGFAGVLLGLALAGIYLVPAIHERNWISSTLALLPGLNPRNHFIFSSMPPGPDWDFHNAVVRTASWVSVSLLVGCALAIYPAWRRNRKLAVSMAVLALLIVFLLTRPALPVWNHLPELVFVQFPWRFDTLLGAILAVLVVFALSGVAAVERLRPAITIPAMLVLLAALVLPTWHFFQQDCGDDDAVPARIALYHANSGSDPIDEYTPEKADGDTLDEGDPGYWLLAPSDEIDSAPAKGTPPGQAPTHLTLTLTEPEVLVLNRRAYPIWQLSLKHHPVQSTSERNDGLLTVNLPAGTSTIDLSYSRPWDFLAGIALSLLSLIFAVALYRWPQIRARSRRQLQVVTSR